MPVKLSETMREPNYFINRLTHWRHLEGFVTYNKEASSFIEFAALAFAVFCILPGFLERNHKGFNPMFPFSLNFLNFFEIFSYKAQKLLQNFFYVSIIYN